MRQWPEDGRIRGTGERRTDGQTLPADPCVTDRQSKETGETGTVLPVAIVSRRAVLAAAIVVTAQAAAMPAARERQGKDECEEGECDSTNHRWLRQRGKVPLSRWKLDQNCAPAEVNLNVFSHFD
jgi:hypothetical protein